MPNVREQIADRITGGQLSETRNALVTTQGQYKEVLAETRKLSRDIDNLKEGGMIAEGYNDGHWNSRLALDQQWSLISGASQHRVIQKSEVDLYHDLLNFDYHFAPLVKAAIDIKTLYTFGLSFSITSEADQDTIDEIMNDPKNSLAFFGQKAIIEADHDLQKSGNVFIAVYHKLNPVQIRAWSSYEIGDIINDPDDCDIPLYYIRSYTDAAGNYQTRAYPSIYNDDYAGIIKINGAVAEVDNTVLVYHMSEGKGLKQKFALSPYTSALRWNRAYEGFLMDFAAIVKMIRKYTTMFTTTGGDAQVSALATQFNHEQHGHHAQQVGDSIISTEGNDFKVIDAGSSKIVGLSDSRAYLMQFCTAVKIPENMLTGNPQTGNRASSQELTSNFLPVIEERQTRWEEAFKTIFAKILGNTDSEISFPPLRSQDALTYLQGLMGAAVTQGGTLTGVVRPVDLIRAVYESLDLKLPPETDVDQMVADMTDKMGQDPAMATALDNLAAAATRMQGATAKT